MRPARDDLRPSARLSSSPGTCILDTHLPIKQNGPPAKKPRGVAIEPDVMLAIKVLEAAPLARCLRAIHDSILALESYESVPFKRKPIGFRRATKSESNRAGGDSASRPRPRRPRPCWASPRLGRAIGNQSHAQGEPTKKVGGGPGCAYATGGGRAIGRVARQGSGVDSQGRAQRDQCCYRRRRPPTIPC